MFWLFVLFISNLLASDPFLAESEREKSWTSSAEGFLIGGLINPATGQFTLMETDLIANGVEPLSLKRYYVSPAIQNSYSGWSIKNERRVKIPFHRGNGWVFFPHLIGAYRTIDQKGNGEFAIWEPDGTALLFKKKKSGRFFLDLEGPFTNSNGVKNSSTLDVRNTICVSKDGGIVLHSKDGCVRTYKEKSTDTRFTYYYLDKERLANGRLILYFYDNLTLNRIESRDPTGKHTYASLQRDGNDWVTHTGLRASYHFDSITLTERGFLFKALFQQHRLSSVHSPLVNKQYRYSDKHILLSELRNGEERGFSFPGVFYGKTSTRFIQPDNSETRYRFFENTYTHQIIDRNRSTTFSWDSFGRLSKIWEEGLYTKSFRSDRYGNPAWEAFIGDLSGEGKEEFYSIKREFDNHRLLKEITDSGLTTRYTYLSGTNLVTSKTQDGNDGLHTEEYYEYDDYNNLIKKTVNNKTTSYSLYLKQPHLHRIKWIVTDEQRIHLEYDQFGNVSREDHYDSDEVHQYTILRTHNERGQILSETDALGELTTYNYNADGQLTDVSRPKKRFEYDKYGRQTSFSDGINTTIYEYDAFSNLAKKTDPYGSTSYSYQDKKLVSIAQGDKVTRFQYDKFGRQISRTDANGHTTRYAYNSRNQPTRINYPDGGEETFIYYLDGKLKQHLNLEGNAITYEYDTLGRITKKIYDGIGSETFVYDGTLLLSQTDLEGYITEYSYDDFDRKIKEERCERVIAYTYDSLGRIDTVMKGGIITTFKYDLLNRVISESTPQSTTTYTYDVDGNKTSITTGEMTEKFGYDAFKRLIWKQDAIGNVTMIGYEGLEKKTIYPAGIITIEKMDRYGNVISKETPNAMAFRYQYDLEGNLTTEEEDVYKNGERIKTLLTTYTYTPKNKIASKTQNGETTTYTYTPSGKVQTKTKPDGTVIHYAYDKFGNLIQASSDTFVYNNLGHLVAGRGFERIVDPFGNTLKETLSNGLSIEKSFDDFDRPLTTTLPTGTIHYTYDEQLKSITYKGYTHTYSYSPAGYILGSGPTTYERNGAGQIVRIKTPLFKQECRYDTRGNLIFATPHSYTYDELNHFVPPNAPLIGKLKEQNNFIPTHDFLDRITKTTDTTSSYDALGRCLSKNEELYLYDGLTEVATCKNGRCSAKINDVLIDFDGTLAVPLFDAANQLRFLVDPTSHKILNKFSLDPANPPS